MTASRPAAAATEASADSAILILLSGGPSQLDTWDPKPQAPSSVRGPFRSISTNVVGMQVSELFPRMACHADKFALVRSVYHDQAPVHEIGTAILQGGSSDPVIGARSDNHFTHSCQDAVRLVETGVRMVTIEMFSSLYDRLTWDCHANEADLPPRWKIIVRFARCSIARFAACSKDIRSRSPVENPGGVRRSLGVRRPSTPVVDEITGLGFGRRFRRRRRTRRPGHRQQRPPGCEPRDRPVNARQISATMLRAGSF